MKRVVLIGDSIRMGYEATVRSALEGAAEIWTPGQENGGTSRNVLARLEEWVVGQRPDIVHVNAGLHDLARDPGQPGPRVELAEYPSNVRAILKGIRERTKARVVWALSTPVNQQWHHQDRGFDRHEADVTAYNAAAAGVCRELGVPVNDLYGLVMAAGRDQLLQKDGVHFKPEGYALLGCGVANVIRALLV